MDKDSIVIQCFDRCKYNLAYPDFFLTADKPALRKLFKWMFLFYWRNEETIEFLERELPDLKDLVRDQNDRRILAAKRNLSDKENYYQAEYVEPKTAATPEEKRNIKEHNAMRMQRVKDARSRLNRVEKQAQKDLERVKEIIAIYQEAKTKFN